MIFVYKQDTNHLECYRFFYGNLKLYLIVSCKLLETDFVRNIHYKYYSYKSMKKYFRYFLN